MDQVKRILIVSDGTGATAKRLLDAVLAQYSEKEVRFTLAAIYSEVRSLDRLEEILARVEPDDLVLFSLIDRELDRHCREALTGRRVLHLDVLEPMVLTLSKFLGIHPDYKPGLLQIIDERYYRRVDAIGFTVDHDDGRGQLVDRAEVVLIGPSRTCKTPISMYLACNFGLHAANIPIFPEPASLQHTRTRLAKVPRERVFGLTLSPEVLAKVRRERRVLSHRNPQLHENLSRYCDLRSIQLELEMSHRFYAELDVDVINVTWRAIEEVAKEIVRKLSVNGVPQDSVAD